MRFVVCAGMYRACSTWQYVVASHLVESKLGGERLGFLEGDPFRLVREGRLRNPGIGVLKTHDAHPVFAETLRDGRSSAVYVFRDLRDVTFSYMTKFRLSYSELKAKRILPKLITNDDFWRSQPGLLCQRYEDLVVDPVEGIESLARHLGADLAPGEAARLAEEYSWESNLFRTWLVRRQARLAGVDLANRSEVFPHDPVTLLHWNHLRVGPAKGWRELATRAQCEELADLCGDWLVANGYEKDMAWVASVEEDRKEYIPDLADDVASFRNYPRSLLVLNRALGRILRLFSRVGALSLR